jgi:opacity protein-like surface antigen
MFKRTVLLASIALVAAMASATSAEAKVRLKPINCPVAKAVESFRITGARGELEGVRSEYQWLGANRPGWKRTEQALVFKGNKAYDLLTIVKGRKKQVICFDITAFFGKRDF